MVIMQKFGQSATKLLLEKKKAQRLNENGRIKIRLKYSPFQNLHILYEEMCTFDV